MSKKGALTAMAVMGAMAMLGEPDKMIFGKGNAEPKEPKKRMPLTDEEAEQLSKLSGKEKKLFVKELKQKYGM